MEKDLEGSGSDQVEVHSLTRTQNSRNTSLLKILRSYGLPYGAVGISDYIYSAER
jgi:hypothetical protein